MCSYCGCHENPLIGRFMDEHDVLINAMGELRRAIGQEDAASVAAGCDRIAALFAPHAEDEEAGIFHEMKLDPTFTAQIEELCSEHHLLDELVLAIRGGDWSRYPEFEQRLRTHIDKEDNGLFPAANIALFGDAWERIQERTEAAMAARGEQVPGDAPGSHAHGHHHHH